MENLNRLILTISILILLVMVFFLILGTITRFTGFVITGSDNDIDDCLRSRDIKLYIDATDSKTELNKIMNKEYLSDIRIINCHWNKDCLMIASFPTWEIDGQKINKDINFQELIERTKC